MNMLYLLFGGGVGAILRYLIGLGIMKKYPTPAIPVAMLTVNLLGSFGLGFFFSIRYAALPQNAYEDPFYLLIGIGFFGAFTTFSTFSVEAVDLIRHKKFGKAAVYILLSIVGSIVCFLIGFCSGLLVVR
ncbi:Putative fluoride ion transporter CrcB [Bacillus sp. THAF10]|uniref:fluoride efflux transporter CrcB n=1 Tax=Bacillus sp. THAF10 TaxID=2587848 RepID=UPI001268C57D|nr:fluoride efflux transporter CrcB [Bacillus sp. THAF10]QFT87917.1 Putative fluoride ion transporter CrcB [Bacillus sp. THAF10]